MNHRIKTFRDLFSMLLIMQSLALAHGAPQGPKNPSPPESEATDRIPIEASLNRDIRAVDALLNEQGPVLMSDLDWFKSMGYLCRRTKTDITRELTKAESNLSKLETMRRSGALDPIHARRIAYTLGMEADALSKQAVRLDEAVTPAENDRGIEDVRASRKRQRAVQALSTISGALHNLANAIVENLRRN